MNWLKKNLFTILVVIAIFGSMILGVAGWIYIANFTESQEVQAADSRSEIRLGLCRQLEVTKEVDRETLREEIAQSERFLNMTFEERIEFFGPDLATIPDEVIQTGLNRDIKTLQKLAPNDCNHFAETGEFKSFKVTLAPGSRARDFPREYPQ